MKKLLIVLSLFIVSCAEVHVTYPLIVEGVESSFATCKNVSSRYRVRFSTNHVGDYLYMYTDTLFQVGDTIK